MVFNPPEWVPDFDIKSIPDSIPVSQFMLDEKFGRCKLEQSKVPFSCGLSDINYSISQVKERVDFLARVLAKDLGWSPNEGSEWDKLITIFAENILDNIPLSWALHNLSGISSPANSAFNALELAHQIKASRSKALFTCVSLLQTALQAAKKNGIPKERIYILSTPQDWTLAIGPPSDFKTVDRLVLEGSRLPSLEPLRWSTGQGGRQCAFLMFSSGTTGLPKGVMVSHKNVIANILQLITFEKPQRKPGQQNVVLGLLPQSHIYGLLVVCHASIYRGDSVVVLPRFDLKTLANAVRSFQINVLFIVPPIMICMISSKALLDDFDLSSVAEAFTGAAPLAAETYKTLCQQYPSWNIRQAFGMTETATVVSATSTSDVFPGPAGSLLLAVQARIISLEDGTDITGCGKAGELLLRSPSVTNLGYLNDGKATRETFGIGDQGWLRTGDEAMFLEGPHGDGHQHLYIVDRIKELIKVKGHQVAPAELEACLLTHPMVFDAAVISKTDAAAGEIPKAFVLLSRHDQPGQFNDLPKIIQEINSHVRREKAHYKWLKGGIEIVNTIPRSASGKILRRILRDAQSDRERKQGAKI